VAFFKDQENRKWIFESSSTWWYPQPIISFYSYMVQEQGRILEALSLDEAELAIKFKKKLVIF